MKFKTIINQISSGQSSLILNLLKMSNEFYRAGFISTALSNGIYENFDNGTCTCEQLCEKLGVNVNQEGLSAWLELGVKLGELKRNGKEYEIKGKLSKALINPDNDAYRALLEEVVTLHYSVIINTPGILKKQKKFPFDESTGELIARSSRVAEPFIFEAVDAIIPVKGKFHLLEVGCGTGVYIKRACARNSELTAVGLELQQEVAAFAQNNMTQWGLGNKVNIQHCNVKDYHSEKGFDLLTLHQNIYYFPTLERIELFSHLIEYLQPGGQILITSIGQGGGPGMQALNIWCSTTEGYGPMPDPDELCRQLLEAAGFVEVKSKRLIPFESFWAFTAAKPK